MHLQVITFDCLPGHCSPIEIICVEANLVSIKCGIFLVEQHIHSPPKSVLGKIFEALSVGPVLNIHHIAFFDVWAWDTLPAYMGLVQRCIDSRLH